MRIILLSPGGYKSAGTQNSKVSVNSDHLGLFPALPLSRNVFLTEGVGIFHLGLNLSKCYGTESHTGEETPFKCHAGCLNLVFDGCTEFVTGL